MMLRRTLSALLLIGLFSACGGNKDLVNSEKAVEQQEANDGYTIGRVTTEFIGDGCPLLIKLEETGIYIIPVAMEDNYKRNGLRLKFKYRPSRASSGECRKGNPAVLEEVTVVTATPPTRVKENQ
jgi:hypothetical protein